MYYGWLRDSVKTGPSEEFLPLRHLAIFILIDSFHFTAVISMKQEKNGIPKIMNLNKG